MKRIMILAAAGIVLVANASVVISVLWNRTETRGGTIELTERELRLPNASGESTAIFLELEWDVLSVSKDEDRVPRWLDSVKLTELGFDCHVPMTHPNVRAYYRSLVPKMVFVVLEYEGEAWKNASPDRRQITRLFAVDAGKDPYQLRKQYTDAGRYIITRGLVRVIFRDHSKPDGKPLPQPLIEGVIERVLPEQIFVPLPYCKTLESLRHHNGSPDDRKEEDGKTEKEPRYAVTVSWGKHYEPWVVNIRQLSFVSPNSK